MSQTPDGYGAHGASNTPESYPPAENYETVPDPYAAPVDPYAAPVDPYAQPDPYVEVADPYAAPAVSYDEPVGSYGTDTYTNTYGTKDVAKDEAANVKNTAVEQGQQVAGTAKDEAANVKDTAVQAGQQVAGTAKEEATNVAVEAGGQAKDIARQAVGELQSQAGAQQQKIAGLVNSYASELGSLASTEESSGPITDLTQRASEKAREVGQWLENREPRELVQELTSFARRRPGAFLAGAAVAGVIVGRLTRNLAAEAKDDAAPSRTATSTTDTDYGVVGSASYATPTYTSEAPLTDSGYQAGRYGDLASEDQVVGYDTPTRTTGQDIR